MEDWIIRYWTEVLFGIICAAGVWVWRKTISRSKAMQKDHEITLEGMKALLRDRIIQAYNHYMSKGECPIYARQNVLALYQVYVGLGGNGTVGNLMETLKGLPTGTGEEQ